MFHNTVKVYNQKDNSLLIDGIQEFTNRYQQRLVVDKAHATLVNRMVLGNTVIDYEHVTTIHSDEITKAIAIYEVIDNKIQTVWFINEY